MLSLQRLLLYWQRYETFPLLLVTKKLLSMSLQPLHDPGEGEPEESEEGGDGEQRARELEHEARGRPVTG